MKVLHQKILPAPRFQPVTFYSCCSDSFTIAPPTPSVWTHHWALSSSQYSEDLTSATIVTVLVTNKQVKSKYIQKEWTPTASLSTSRNRGCLIIFKYFTFLKHDLKPLLIYFESRKLTTVTIFLRLWVKSSMWMTAWLLHVEALNLSGSDQTSG